MKILAGRIDWVENYDNAAHLHALVDYIPKLEELRFERRGHLYYAELDGYCRFFCYDRPGEGFGGAVYHLHMQDGSEVDLKGPWSSGTYAMNRAGFGPCVPCALTTDPQVWERGHTFYGCDITLPLAHEVARLAGSFLVYGGEQESRASYRGHEDVADEQRGVVECGGVRKAPSWSWVPDPEEKQRRRRVARWKQSRQLKKQYGWEYVYLVMKPIWSFRPGEARPSDIVETVSHPKDLEALVRDGVLEAVRTERLRANFPRFTLVEEWPCAS